MEQSTLNKHVVSVTKLSGTGLGIELLQIEHKGDNYFAGNIYIEALREIAALREAGEKMAEALRHNKRVVDLGNPNTSWAFIDEDAAALEAWEAANK